MATYKIELGGKSHTIKIKKLQESSAVVEVDGKSLEVTYEKQLDQPQARPSPASDSTSKMVTATDSRPAATTTTTASCDGFAVEAPIPGLILEIKVSPGDTVQPDQVLLVMEAMKMENPIKSPLAGTIKQVYVKTGAGVATGDALVLIG